MFIAYCSCFCKVKEMKNKQVIENKPFVIPISPMILHASSL